MSEPSTPGNAAGNAAGDDQMELLMRHSSPVVRAGSAESPLSERNSSPSPLRMNRPRSNPRNRTPMRYTSPLNADAFRIPEGDQEGEARRISIRPLAGRAVGTTMAGPSHMEPRRPFVKSHKQGPSHRKQRRWNNDNFVNLASELHNSGKGGRNAAQVLLLGQADASKYRCIYDPAEHQRKTGMTQLMKDEKLQGVKEQFFDGELHHHVQPARSHKATPSPGPLTPEQMLHRIEARLRRVVVKACENSMPASKVVETLEHFLVRVYSGKSDKTKSWDSILMEPPTVTHRKRDDAYITRFVFDGESPNSGFHRLLLHGLCQFHGLQANSSTLELTIQGSATSTTQARLLTATGTLSGADVRLVDYIMQRKEQMEPEGTTQLAMATAKLATLKV